MRSLIPCPACHRHVESDETACPFCGVAFPAARPCAGGCSGPHAARVARAALVAAGAALLGAACSSPPSKSVVPLYGVPPHVDAAPDGPQDAGTPTDGSPDADDAK